MDLASLFARRLCLSCTIIISDAWELLVEACHSPQMPLMVDQVVICTPGLLSHGRAGNEATVHCIAVSALLRFWVHLACIKIEGNTLNHAINTNTLDSVMQCY